MVTKNAVITKSNSLIEARYKLSVEEQRIILYLVSMVQPSDEDFKRYQLLIRDFMRIVDVKNKGLYKQFLHISENLTSKTLTIEKDNSTLVMSWLSSAEYFEGEGRIELSFDPKLKPYLLKLKNNFTSYKLENVIRLKSFYSIRIYELLKQYERLHERTFLLQDLRDSLCINEAQYPMYANFKQKVLNVAKKELQEKSDIFFEFEEVKIGRKVEKIKFLIFKNDAVIEKIPELSSDNILEIRDEDAEEIRKVKVFLEDDLTDEEILSILEASNYDIELIENRYAVAKSQRKLESLVAFMVWACKEPDERFVKKTSKSKSKINNYKSRKWDHAEFERLNLEILLEETKAADNN